MSTWLIIVAVWLLVHLLAIIYFAVRGVAVRFTAVGVFFSFITHVSSFIILLIAADMVR